MALLWHIKYRSVTTIRKGACICKNVDEIQ